MRLTELDRAFLRDIETVNWRNHFIVAASLQRAGAELIEEPEHPILDSVLGDHNFPRNLDFFSREPLELTGDLVAEVQSMATLRIFQERIAAFETLGALLDALPQREGQGVAWAHYESSPDRVRRYYRTCLAEGREHLANRLGWPPSDALEARLDPASAQRHTRVRPWILDRILEVADAYILPRGLSVGRLGDAPPDHETRGSVYVVLCHESRWRVGQELSPELVLKAYNMVKHGLNATARFLWYAEAAKTGETAVVIGFPRENELVQQFGSETRLAGVLCREIARMTIELDAVDLLGSGRPSL